MKLYDLIRDNGTGKGEDMMWRTLGIVSEHIESGMDEKHKDALLRDLYGEMSSGHYNEEYAKEDVSRMYYEDNAGKKHYAPYWNDDDIRQVYDLVKRNIPAEYNFWDFYVTLNMIKSDNCSIVKGWFPQESDEEHTKRIIALTVNWLNDADNPYGTEKTWGYLNPSR